VETLTWVMTGATTGSSLLTGINIITVYTFNVGVTNIAYTAIDVNGNESTCSFDVTIVSKPEIQCPVNISANTDPGVCTASLDPGSPIKLSGVEPITWTWEMTGATVGNGTGISITPNPYPFNEGVTLITWIATNISGSDTCYQTITVTDNETPTFDPPPGPLEFCVYSIFDAEYNGLDEPGADINPDRPDWYILSGTNELDIININDNCCDASDMTLSWTITFSSGHPAVNGTGQPSLYGPITLWGNTDFTDAVHTITYELIDCNGISSGPVTVNITIKPRPNVVKQY
jgi:hypothetical protein